MVSLRNVIKLALKFIFVISLTLALGIASDYIYPWLRGKELWIFTGFIKLCRTYWMFLALILAMISVIWFYDWIRETKAEFRRIWGLYKPVKKLTPEDFKIQKYKEAYIHRKSDTTIENLLENGKYILITGKPKIGKTRVAYEEIKKFRNFSVIKPKPERIEEIEKVNIPPLGNKNFILFLDDLQQFIGRDVDDVIDRLKKKSKKLIVVATCRTGEELDLVKERILYLYREFASIELEEISEEEGKRLTTDVGLQWEQIPFDGTPGSITLDLEDMKKRYTKYKKARDDRGVILKALKLLKEGNLFFYKETRVKDVCEDIFELPAERLRRYIFWEGTINDLKEDGFLTTDGDIIYIYSSYLDICVYDYDPSIKDLMKLKDIFIGAKDSGSLFYIGNGFYYKKDFRRAEDCYREALDMYPKYASAHTSLGYVLVKLGEAEELKGGYEEAERLYKEAEKEHRAAIKINPYYAVDHNNLGYVLTGLGEIKEIKGEYGEAKRLYEKAEKEHGKALDINPEYTSAHHSLAYVLGILGKDEEAEKEYRVAIRLNPKSPFAHNLLGHLLAKLGEAEEAEKEYREAIRIKPDYPSAHNNFGHLLTKLGRWEEAEKEYREAIKVFPDYIVAYVNLGHLLTDRKKYKEAEKEHRKALDINPDYAEAHNALGYALVNLKRYDEAEKEYRKAMGIKPDYAEAHTNLGYLLTKLKEYEEAEKEYKKALEINPSDTEALISFGVFLERLGRDQEAEDKYKEVIRINPDNAKAHNTYGYFLSDHWRYKEAEREIREAIRINPDYAEAHTNLGHLLSDLKRYEEAEKEYKMALEINPLSSTTYYSYGNLLKNIKKYKESEDMYNKAIKIDRDYAKAHRNLGILLFEIRRKEDARKELELAIKLFKKRRREEDVKKTEELLNNL